MRRRRTCAAPFESACVIPYLVSAGPQLAVSPTREGLAGLRHPGAVAELPPENYERLRKYASSHCVPDLCCALTDDRYLTSGQCSTRNTLQIDQKLSRSFVLQLEVGYQTHHTCRVVQ
jgi:hypothetical protein